MANLGSMALAALIDEIEHRNEWTDVRVSAQATAAGYKVTPSDISDYRHRGMRQIVPAKLIGLARGLQIPPYRVAIAVLSDVGIDVPFDVRSPEDAIAADTTISAATRRALLAILREDRSG